MGFLKGYITVSIFAGVALLLIGLLVNSNYTASLGATTIVVVAFLALTRKRRKRGDEKKIRDGYLS